jgi:hypothetical protein
MLLSVLREVQKIFQKVMRLIFLFYSTEDCNDRYLGTTFCTKSEKVRQTTISFALFQLLICAHSCLSLSFTWEASLVDFV